ncbi:MAG: 3-phosphoshikimate 1-carboxyvinyltransferase, partial [Clostridia bacterium]|nr:3-phosphoshikimate 1-carboxyvinyltransferase [Clostridia bacterium]
MDAIITPTKLKGTVAIPPSKSLAHRAIICACLACGKSIVSNVALSDDIVATIECMRSLGAKIVIKDGVLEIEGNSAKSSADLTFDCKESGSTLRFILPIALALNSGKNTFVGRGKLGERPMTIYRDICKEQGVEYVDKSLLNANHLLDLSVKGALKSGEYHVDGGVSSQFITGLLFALSLLDGDSNIIVE